MNKLLHLRCLKKSISEIVYAKHYQGNVELHVISRIFNSNLIRNKKNNKFFRNLAERNLI